MKISEIVRDVREKILLLGHTHTGKTYNLVRISVELAKIGKKVAFFDLDDGSRKEWESLVKERVVTKAIDKNINIIFPKDFGELRNYIELVKDKVDVIIIDPLRTVEEVRQYARKKFLEKGKYWIGEKEVSIEDKETFHLRGFMYQLPNELLGEFLRELVRGNHHIICSELVPILTPTKGEPLSIDQLFIETEEERLPKKLKDIYEIIGWFDIAIVTDVKRYHGTFNPLFIETGDECMKYKMYSVDFFQSSFH